MVMQVWSWGGMSMAERRWVQRLEPTPREVLGATIHRLRTRKGLSQKELSTLLWGTDKRQNSVSVWERGNGMPSIVDLPAVADVLGGDYPQMLALWNEETRDSAERRRRIEDDALSQDEWEAMVAPKVAVPDEPGMYEVISEVIAFDDLDEIKAILHRMRTQPGVRERFHAFIAEVMADQDDPERAAAELAASQPELDETIATLNASQPCTNGPQSRCERTPR